MKDLKEPLLESQEHDQVQSKKYVQKYEDQSHIGYIFQFIFVILVCLQQVSSKIVYTRIPELDPLQLIVIRTFFSMGFYALLINVNVKEVMVTSIPPGNYKNLVLRCFQAFLMFPIMMYGIKSMRELNDFTVGAYTNIALLTVFTPYIFIQGIGLDIMSKFEYYDYIQFMIMGFTSVSINISRRTAIRYEEPGKLSGINFFQSIIQLFIDVLFFGTLFIMQQVIGIIIIFAVNFVKMGLWIQRLRHDRQTKNKLLKKLDSES